ncbi:MAG: GNAT family N-acetyltransferase [Syntrophaceae bacterium]
MEIRELTIAELNDLLGLYRHLHAKDDPRPPSVEVESLWHAIGKNHDLKYFGAFVEGSLVSSCTLAIVPNLTRGCRPYGVIENVVTHAGFRRRGYGRAVLQHALAWAWKKNCYKVMLLTSRKDKGTQAFYASAGFDGGAKQAFLAKPPA